MTRVEESLDNKLVQTVKKVMMDIVELKTHQVMGRDSIVPKIVTTENQFDATSYLVLSSYLLSFHIAFHADHQLNPYIFPTVKIYNPDGSVLLDNDTSTTITQNPFVVHKDDGVEEAIISIFHPTIQFKAKLFIHASDTGIITYEESP